MKRILLAGAVAMLCFTACKKENKTTTPANTDNTWKFGNQTYSGNTVTFTASLVCNSTDLSADLVVYFDTLPVTGGSYRIIAGSLGGHNALGLGAAVGSGTPDLAQYHSTDYQQATATVTVTNGKIEVVIPPVYMHNYNSADDSVLVSGTIVQQ